MDEKQLEKRIEDLIRASENQFRYTHTNFLSLAEQDTCLKVVRNDHFYNYQLIGGPKSTENDMSERSRIDMSERRIAVFGNEDELGYPFEVPIKIIKIAPVAEKFADTLSHRDFLGAMLNLGIDRSLTGDIVVHGNSAWVYCLEQIAEYIADSLVKVKHTKVKCEIVSGDIPELSPELKEVRLNVASERLDAVIAALINRSRTVSAELIKAQKVYVNGRLTLSGSGSLKEDDVLSIRGFGKCIYKGIEHETKKGRYYITVLKYI